MPCVKIHRIQIKVDRKEIEKVFILLNVRWAMQNKGFLSIRKVQIGVR